MKLINKIHFCNLLAAIAILSCSHCLCADVNAAADHRARVMVVVEELRSCPSWSDSYAYQTGLRAEITRKNMEMAQNDTETLRDAIDFVLAEIPHENPERHRLESKIFAFLRIVFNIPEGYLDPTSMSTGFGSPWKNGNVDILWPYAYNKDNKLELIGECGHYMGPAYDPLADFDRLSTRFGRRFVIPDLVY